MIKIFRTIDGVIHQVNEAQEGCWIALINPTATEILEIAEEYSIEQDDLRAPLDEEERSRIEVEDDYTMILVDIPVIEERNEKDWYGTIPMSIIVTDEIIFTVCLEDTPILSAFMDGRVRNFTHTKRHALYFRYFTKTRPCICTTCALLTRRVKWWRRSSTVPLKTGS